MTNEKVLARTDNPQKEKPSTYFGRKMANFVLIAVEIAGRIVRTGHIGDISETYYRNARMTAAETISRAIGTNFPTSCNALEIAVSKMLDIEPGREDHDNRLTKRKTELVDMIADYAAFPDVPTHYAREEFVRKYHKELKWGSDIALILPSALPIVPLLACGNLRYAIVATSLVLLAEILTLKPTLSLIHFYINAQMNAGMMRERLGEFREDGKIGYALFLQAYDQYDKIQRERLEKNQVS